MDKLMFALRAADATALRDAAPRTDLALAGVHWMQLNLDDADVAPAFRMAGGQ